jgi:hypothetical protein
MDVLEGREVGPQGRHLASCPACASRLGEARDGLGLARAADVPEPPPFYWQSFRRQVVGRVAGTAASRTWRGWLLPGFATALALAAVFVFAPRPAPEVVPTLASPLPAWSALPPAHDDPELPVLQAVGADLDPELECAGVAECLEDLSEEESEDLVRALRSQVKEWSL